MNNINRTFAAAIVCGLLLSFLAFSAPAAERIIGKLSSAEMIKLLKAEGFHDAAADSDDDVVVKMHGYNVLVFVRENDYTVVRFHAAIGNTGVTLEDVNAWNQQRLFTKAFLDGDGDPVLEMDVDLAGGITEARLRDALRTYVQSHQEFLREVVTRR